MIMQMQKSPTAKAVGLFCYAAQDLKGRPAKRVMNMPGACSLGRWKVHESLAAVGTTGYTLTDSELVKMCSVSPGYTSAAASYLLTFVINFGLGVTMMLLVIFRKSERENFKYLVSSAKNFIYPATAGILSSLAYALVLAAMTKVTQLSFLQAFRQMSLPIGLLLGIIILKEPAHRPKLVGITLIVTGLVLIAFLG